MNMKNKYIAFLCCLAAVLPGCRMKDTKTHTYIPYVASVLADTTSREFSLVRSFDIEDNTGTIAVIGEPEDVIRMTEALLTADSHNNVDGRGASDHLPDFAGETISPIIDLANYPYEDYKKLSNTAFLREVGVRNFLFAMDTSALVSPYDTLHSVRKVAAKAVIYASTSAGIYGFADADTLVRVINPSLTVLSALDVMVDKAREKSDTVLIWTTAEKAAEGIYGDYFAAEGYPARLRERGESGAVKYRVFASQPDSLRDDGSLKGRVLDLLDKYMMLPQYGKIHSVVLDDRSISPAELQKVIDDLLQDDEDYMLVYRNLLAPDCECIWAEKAVSELLYSKMRQVNSFSHKIAYPSMKGYVTLPSASLPQSVYGVDGSLSYGFKYGRESNSPRNTYTFVEMRDRYISETLMEYMADNAPATFALYVR